MESISQLAATLEEDAIRRLVHGFLDNTGPRRLLVIDFEDQHGLDTHAAGAWFLAEGRSESELRAFFALAVHCGGDPMLWGRSQFLRIPDGLRESGAVQHAYCFNRAVPS